MAVIFNPNDPNNSNNQAAQAPEAAPTSPTGAPLQTIGTAAPVNMNQPAGGAPQGSGRFTNLQKYLQANQKGGQQIAGQIGSNLNKQNEQNTQKAQSYYSKLGESVNQANQTAQAGQGYTKQLQDIGANINQAQTAGFDQRDQQAQNLGGIESFTTQPGFQQFQDIQAGRGINENLLALQQQRAAAAAQVAAQGTTEAQQALGNESGRFDLLRKTLGGNGKTGYTQGQQRLDQVLLGQGGGLGGLQAQTAQQNRANIEQSKLAANKLTDVNRLTAQEQGLIGDINTQAGLNEKSYVDMLNSYVDPLNTQRTQEFEGLNKAVGSYAGTPEAQAQWAAGQTTGFSADQMVKLGLTDKNTGVYNVFKGPGGVSTAHDIAEQGRQAMNAQDVANQSDVNRYAALSKIIGQNAPQNITKASDLGDAYTAKTGDAGLKERLAAAQAQFESRGNFGTTKINTQEPQYASEVIKNGPSGYGNASYTALPTKAISDTKLMDLINQGRSGLNTVSGIMNTSGTPNTQDQLAMQTAYYLNQHGGNLYSAGTPMNGSGQISTTGLGTMAQELAKRQAAISGVANQQVVDDFSKYLQSQNYGQTLGGQRQTFLDTEAAAKAAAQGIAPKQNQTPITGVDPSIAYMNALKGLKK